MTITEIIVEGHGRECFTPDEVILNLNFYTKGLSYEEVLNKGIKNVQNFINQILIQNNFTLEDMKTRNIIIKEEQKYDEQTKSYIKDGFSFNQYATLKFDYDKLRLAKIIEETSKLLNAPSYNINFGIKNEKECKRKLIARAYKDAELQASLIASSAGKELKQCTKIDFKPFNTEYVSSTSLGSQTFMEANYKMSSGPAILKTFTPVDIELTENLYCKWFAE